jgi:hypothetical protein
MLSDKIAVLKTKQDALDSRKENLLAKFVPFREGLIHELERFIENAISSGLRNVKKLRRVKDSTDLIEAEFTLNDLELCVVSNNNTNNINMMIEDLAAKIFIFFTGDENNTPIIEISFIESSNNEYQIRALWYLQNDARNLSADIRLTEETVIKVVSLLVNHLYRFEFTWRDQPTMKATLGTGAKGSFGFVKE